MTNEGRISIRPARKINYFPTLKNFCFKNQKKIV